MGSKREDSPAVLRSRARAAATNEEQRGKSEDRGKLMSDSAWVNAFNTTAPAIQKRALFEREEANKLNPGSFVDPTKGISRAVLDEVMASRGGNSAYSQQLTGLWSNPLMPGQPSFEPRTFMPSFSTPASPMQPRPPAAPILSIAPPTGNYFQQWSQIQGTQGSTRNNFHGRELTSPFLSDPKRLGFASRLAPLQPPSLFAGR